MKVLEVLGVVVTSGGTEAFVYNIVNHMRRDDLEIDFLTPYASDDSFYRPKFASLGGCYYNLGLPYQANASNLYRMFRDFLKSHAYDVVHIHATRIMSMATLAAAAKRAGVKTIIVHSHNTGERDSLKHRVTRALGAISMRKSVTVYCACSRDAADWKFVRKEAEQAKIVNNGIDVDAFVFNAETRDRMRRQLGYGEKEYVVGHAGHFNRQKNHPFLIEAFAEIARRAPEARLLLVGDGEDEDRIRDLIAKKGLTDRTVFTGVVSNVNDYMQAMDAFLFPSLYEGLGIVAIEAQTADLPLIASDRVPREAQLLDDVAFLPLEAPLSTWAERVLAFRGRTRGDRREEVRAAGYDVVDSAETVRKLYMRGLPD